MLIFYLNLPCQRAVIDGGDFASTGPSVIPSGLINIFFKLEEDSTSDSSELMTSCFPFDLLDVVPEPTMLEVTSGHSTLENDLFLRE